MEALERTTPDECCFMSLPLEPTSQTPVDTSFEEFCLNLAPLPSSSPLDLTEFERAPSPVQARSIQKIDFSTISSDCTVGPPSASLSITVSECEQPLPSLKAARSIVLKPFFPASRKRARCGSQQKHVFWKTPSQTVTSEAFPK